MTEVPQDQREQAWTDPDDILTDQTVTLKHVRTRSGEPCRVQVRIVPSDKLVVAMEGWPVSDKAEAKPDTLPSAVRLKQSLDTLAKWEPPAARVAELGIVGPPVSFGEKKPGTLHWESIPLPDRVEVVNTILALSGFDSEGTRDMRTFPDEEGSGGTGS